MKKNDYILSGLIAAVCCLFIAVISVTVGNIGFAAEGTLNIKHSGEASVQMPDTQVNVQTQATTQPTTQAPTQNGNSGGEQATAPNSENVSKDAPLTSTKEIIDKYTLLVDKFKKEKPAYKKKEYQALPEENREFSSAINSVLGIAANYMVSEEDCEELIREAGSEEILYDMPIHGAEKGCTLTDYDAVEWAKCEDLGDGTYKISFSLKEEHNAEPTPADTLVAPSAHGAVMQPVAIKDIKAEVDKVVSKLPGITLNTFDLIYRDCVFSCVYDPKTDEVKSITHNIAIDISADVKVFSADIVGSARLINDMLIYDITW
ncbi:MAG: hypothetical protein IJW86_01255 [Clostridia bacterium]|nr:hypothetical protein [Clostridia bacterium]